MTRVIKEDNNQWYFDIRHNGLFVSLPVLSDILPEGPGEIGEDVFEVLEKVYFRFQADLQSDMKEETGASRRKWIVTLLSQLAIPAGQEWYYSFIPDFHTLQADLREEMRDHNLIVLTEKRNGLANFSLSTSDFIVYITDKKQQLGIGKAKQNQAFFTRYLRNNSLKVGLFTNGEQFRLIFAGDDNEAWIEWDAAQWFDRESNYRYLLDSFIAFLSARGDKFDLVDVVNKSRDKQADLSSVLGIQAREAIEIFLGGHVGNVETSQLLIEALLNRKYERETLLPTQLEPVYQAAVRILMRFIFVFYAEARELLPLNNPVYRNSYSLEQLFLDLERASQQYGEHLDEEFNAWQRILGLFELIYYGSPFDQLAVIAYGGTLFEPGERSSQDAVTRVLSVLESRDWLISDMEVLEIFRKLRKTTIKTKIGRQTSSSTGNIDFSELRTEYIGMIYEGLLDYQVRFVSEEDVGILVLNLGSEFTFSLQRLEKMSDQELMNLVKNIQKEAKSIESSDLEVELPTEYDQIESMRDRAMKIITKMIKVAKLKKNPEELLADIYAPGKLFLTTWNGSRKGSGTYYTRPRLVYPTVERVLKPLVYSNPEDPSSIKTPEEILELNVCDPAMGSGSFLVSATNYLGNVIYESCQTHGRIREADTTIGLSLYEGNYQIRVPIFGDDPMLIQQLAINRIKRYVVEECIYGVDINPFAVELAKLALWIETMDMNIPFKFLDHHLKVGNSLVGSWFKDAFFYPIRALYRDTADKSHSKKIAVHHPPKQNYDLLKAERNLAKSQLIEILDRLEGQTTLDQFFTGDNIDVMDILDKYESFQPADMDFLDEDRIQKYYGNYLGDEYYQFLKLRFDYWCAIWFMSPDIEKDGDKIVSDAAFKSSIKSPYQFFNEEIVDRERIQRVAHQVKFFHWELEFPSIFLQKNPGFDAIVGNPPWDVAKPNSLEFFSNYDPMYSTYSKQDALKAQKALFEKDKSIEEAWLNYEDQFKALSNLVSTTGESYDVGSRNNDSYERHRSEILNKLDNIVRSSPYIYQGSADMNTYKMFTELTYHLTRHSGRVGFIIPSGIYSDAGTKELRELFLNECSWEWLFVFHNRKKIFPIHGSYKFCPIIYEKGGVTEEINTSFMREDLDDWEEIDEEILIDLSLDDVKMFSPEYLSFVEITDIRDLEIMRKIYQNGTPIGRNFKGEWELGYKCEFHSTNDSNLFIPYDTLDQEKFKNHPDFKDFGIIPYEIDGKDTYLLPLYKGRSIHIGNFASQKYLEGHGNSAKYQKNPRNQAYTVCQNYLKLDDASSVIFRHGKNIPKIVFRKITNATNSRTMISTIIPNFPSEDGLPVLDMKFLDEKMLWVSASLNSLIFDYAVRNNLSGINLNQYVIVPLPLPEVNCFEDLEVFTELLISKYFGTPIFSKWLIKFKENHDFIPFKTAALTTHEHKRIDVIINAILLLFYDITFDEAKFVLRNDDENQIGFQRVDKELKEELRLTTLTLEAYEYLLEVGIDQFLEEDYQFPHHIQKQLGPRFLDWQIEMTEEEAWAKCEEYAERLEKIYSSVKSDEGVEEVAKQSKDQAGLDEYF